MCRKHISKNPSNNHNDVPTKCITFTQMLICKSHTNMRKATSKSPINCKHKIHAEVQLPSVPQLSLLQKNISSSSSSLAISSNDQVQSLRPNSSNLKQVWISERGQKSSAHSPGGSAERWVGHRRLNAASYDERVRRNSEQTDTPSYTTYSLPTWETLKWWGQRWRGQCRMMRSMGPVLRDESQLGCGGEGKMSQKIHS